MAERVRGNGWAGRAVSHSCPLRCHRDRRAAVGPWLSSSGVGHTLDWSSTAQKLIYRSLLRSVYADKAIADERIRSSGLDWTVSSRRG
ncbi:hypothetical protein SGFS_011530 [Streptomyces graminofaciens]|uniref:Uncharacterized protein n=2 Tax=Streptomyces graminofaciens TaxID=68212 RepID=A0ABM7F283_9ACTN|nr:hypothetical protein SGFS_011530 [Streptomyces graminofaciens]